VISIGATISIDGSDALLYTFSSDGAEKNPLNTMGIKYAALRNELIRKIANVHC
jgi:hypothetical protein